MGYTSLEKEYVAAGKYLIQVIRSVLDKTPIPKCSQEMNVVRLIEVAKLHQCLGILYAGRDGWIHVSQITDELRKKIEREFQNVIFKDTVQQNELIAITEELSEAKIRHLPLKGAILKQLYPISTMREMSDIDILVEKDRIRECKPLMEGLGYIQESEEVGDHDIYQKKPAMDVELHWDLFEEDWLKDKWKYYADILEHVRLVEGKAYEYEMTKEQFYVYLIAHMNKHHVSGGSGIRGLMDICVYLKHYHGELDWNYIMSELEALGLTGYEVHVRKMVQTWFEFDTSIQGKTAISSLSDEEMEEETKRLILGGAYGTIEGSELGKLISEYSGDSFFLMKCRRLVRLAFPGEKALVFYFPNVAHVRSIRPLLWIGRWLVCLIKKPQKVKGRLKTLSSVKKKEVEAKRKMYEKD